MKKLITLLGVLLISINIPFANEVEGLVLKPNLEVKLGELTGAGTRFSLSALAGFVHPNGYIMKEDCSRILVKTTANPKVSDIVAITVDGADINVTELTGFIIQK